MLLLSTHIFLVLFEDSLEFTASMECLMQHLQPSQMSERRFGQFLLKCKVSSRQLQLLQSWTLN